MHFVEEVILWNDFRFFAVNPICLAMKKIIFILFVFISTTLLVNAQSPVNLGIKAGYSSSKITTDFSEIKEGSVDNYLAGAFVRLNLGKIYIQPEAYFNSKGGKLSSETINTFDLKAIDIPVLVGYKLIDKRMFNVRVNAGPLMSFMLEKNSSNGDQFSAEGLKDNFFGWQYGAGVDFLFLSLDMRMENSFGDIYAGSSSEKSKAFLISLGIKLM